MPVENHPVHEKTRIGADFRYGCHNRKDFASGYRAIDRVAGSNGYEAVWHMCSVVIPFTMSRDCQYDLSASDAACEGCKHRR